MTRSSLVFVLYLVAAALALTAAIITYVRHGQINVSMIAATILLAAFGFLFKTRMR